MSLSLALRTACALVGSPSCRRNALTVTFSALPNLSRRRLIERIQSMKKTFLMLVASSLLSSFSLAVAHVSSQAPAGNETIAATESNNFDTVTQNSADSYDEKQCKYNNYDSQAHQAPTPHEKERQ